MNKKSEMILIIPAEKFSVRSKRNNRESKPRKNIRQKRQRIKNQRDRPNISENNQIFRLERSLRKGKNIIDEKYQKPVNARVVKPAKKQREFFSEIKKRQKLENKDNSSSAVNIEKRTFKLCIPAAQNKAACHHGGDYKE